MMATSKNSFELRIITTAFLIGTLIVGLVAYNTYSEDIKEHFSEKIVELFPDMEGSLAAL